MNAALGLALCPQALYNNGVGRTAGTTRKERPMARTKTTPNRTELVVTPWTASDSRVQFVLWTNYTRNAYYIKRGGQWRRLELEDGEAGRFTYDGEDFGIQYRIGETAFRPLYTPAEVYWFMYGRDMREVYDAHYDDGNQWEPVDILDAVECESKKVAALAGQLGADRHSQDAAAAGFLTAAERRLIAWDKLISE